jgi:ribosomal protein S18 acetylase RimI-like enzyme
MNSENLGAGLLGEFQYCRALDSGLRMQAASLVCDALPAFYATLGSHSLNEILAEEFREEGCELSETVALVRHGVVEGIITAYPSSEIKNRQQGSLHHLVSQIAAEKVSSFMNQVRMDALEMPPVPTSSCYVARISVQPEQRGRGLAAKLLGKIMTSDFACVGWSLHVDHKNLRAVAFYRKHGFSIWGAAGNRYMTMHRVT